jgi:LysM repeat protein
MKKSIFKVLFFVFIASFSQTKEQYDLYRVKKGDTYISISNKFDMSIDEFKQINAYSDNATLITGVSVFVKKTSNPRYYLVKRKETLYSIAKKFRVTVEKLKSLNKLKDNSIRVGQRLKIR